MLKIITAYKDHTEDILTIVKCDPKTLNSTKNEIVGRFSAYPNLRMVVEDFKAPEKAFVEDVKKKVSFASTISISAVIGGINLLISAFLLYKIFHR